MRAVFVAVTALSGSVFWGLAVSCYRRWKEPGSTAFAAVAGIFGVGAVTGSAVAFLRDGLFLETRVLLWSEIGLVVWAFAMVPWFVFALQYTGRHLEFRWRTILAVAAPILGVNALLFVRQQGLVDASVLSQLFGTLSLLYMFALVAVASYLLLRTTYQYGHLSVALGVVLTVAGFAPLLFINSAGTLSGETTDVTVLTMFVLAFVVPASAFLLAVFRYQMFDSTPASGALGERAIPRETDDLVFVVDRDDRVVKLNETASETLDVPPARPLGDSFLSLTGTTVDDLAEMETVTWETDAGQRQFDPQVTAFTDQHGRRLGSLVSLRDVTERELRKQRLEVLNRVLRHNLRNRVDVIASNAEALADEVGGDRVAAIQSSVDELAALGAKARATDQLVSRPVHESRGDLATIVRDVASVDTDSVTVSVEAPDAAPLVTDLEALRAALDSVMENAVENAEATVTVTVSETPDGYVVTVADDGPGIPDSELESLAAGTETSLQHGTGLGLWRLKWAVRKLNGDLSFDTTDGTTVRIEVPDRDA